MKRIVKFFNKHQIIISTGRRDVCINIDYNVATSLQRGDIVSLGSLNPTEGVDLSVSPWILGVVDYEGKDIDTDELMYILCSSTYKVVDRMICEDGFTIFCDAPEEICEELNEYFKKLKKNE